MSWKQNLLLTSINRFGETRKRDSVLQRRDKNTNELNHVFLHLWSTPGDPCPSVRSPRADRRRLLWAGECGGSTGVWQSRQTLDWANGQEGENANVCCVSIHALCSETHLILQENSRKKRLWKRLMQGGGGIMTWRSFTMGCLIHLFIRYFCQRTRHTTYEKEKHRWRNTE